LKSAWESFENSLKIVYKRKGEVRGTEKRCEYLQHNVKREEFFNKRDNYQNKYKKERLFTNFKIKTIEKNNNHVITIEDITFISQELYSLITPRMKYQITNGLKSGITYNTFNQLYTVKFNDETIETFKTEDEAYNEVIKYKQNQLQNYAINNPDKLDEEIYNILINITPEQTEKLIMIDNSEFLKETENK
jgi:hypothetical protein